MFAPQIDPGAGAAEIAQALPQDLQAALAQQQHSVGGVGVAGGAVVMAPHHHPPHPSHHLVRQSSYKLAQQQPILPPYAAAAADSDDLLLWQQAQAGGAGGGAGQTAPLSPMFEETGEDDVTMDVDRTTTSSAASSFKFVQQANKV